jgi:hypothetical protein
MAAKGTITGRIMKLSGQAMANAAYELCGFNCTDGGPRVAFKTDGDGKFTITDVETREFGSIYDPLTRTARMLSDFLLENKNPKAKAKRLTCCTELKAGKTLDLGQIRAPR